MATNKFTVLLTLGRQPRALALARSLHAAGCRVIVAETYRWHLCRMSRAVAKSYVVTAPSESAESYLGGLLDIVSKENVGLVIPIAEEAIHVSRLRDRLPENVRLLCAPTKPLAQLNNKLLFNSLAKKIGLAVPLTFTETSPQGKALMKRGDYVAKPSYGSSGIGVSVCRRGMSHKPGIPGMLVQQHLEGDLISSLSLLHKGRELSTVLYRGKVHAGTVAVCFERVHHAPEVNKWVTEFARRTKFSGFVGFDFIVDTMGKAQAIECNPKVTNGVHFMNSDDLAAGLIRPASVNEVDREPTLFMQWGYMTFFTMLKRFPNVMKMKSVFMQMLKCKDVVWSPKDPMPAITYLLTNRRYWYTAVRSRTTILALMQDDIAWSPNPRPKRPSGKKPAGRKPGGKPPKKPAGKTRLRAIKGGKSQAPAKRAAG